MIRKYIFVALLSSALTPAFAQETLPAEDEASSEAIIVTGRASQLYRAGETSSGKLPTEPLASSQAISIITEELIDDQGARDAQDLYRNISGVSVFSYAGVTARGFRQQENFYDGLRGDPYIGFSVPQLFNISRVEFLKGPAGMLYGQTAPGGLFNYVTKKPTKEFEGKLALAGGTGNRYGAQGEISGPVNDTISVRAGAFFEDRDTPRFNSGNKAMVLDTGVALDFDVARFNIQALHISQDLDGNRLRGVPVNNAGEFLASRRWNHNEPGDFLNLRSTSVQAKVELDITSNLKIDAAVRRIDATETQKYHEPNGLVDTNGDTVADLVPRQYRDQFRDNGMWSFGANAVWSAQLGDNISNRFLAGFDQSSSTLLFEGRSLSGRNIDTARLPCPISLPNPVYGRCDPATYNLPAFTRTITDTERRGFYALNELTVGKLIGVLGIRTDSFEDASGTARFKGSDESYRLGLVYRATDDISLFGQYATSFEPQSAASQDPRAGGPFDPTTGDIIEGGIKTALMGGRIQSTVAVYQIKRQNILQADPRGDPEGDGVNNSVAFGEVTSKGVDVDIAADISRDWVLTLTYAYNDARITRDNGRTPLTNAVVGGRFANAPRHKLGFWTRYDLPVTGLAVALGGDYVSKRISLSNQVVKSYFVFDGSLTYETGPFKFLARIDNIFDKTYASSGFNDRGGHFPGEPRSAFLEASYRF
jgi:iron complex outermembrane receptor protein